MIRLSTALLVLPSVAWANHLLLPVQTAAFEDVPSPYPSSDMDFNDVALRYGARCDLDANGDMIRHVVQLVGLASGASKRNTLALAPLAPTSSATFRIDGGAPEALTLGADGRFVLFDDFKDAFVARPQVFLNTEPGAPLVAGRRAIVEMVFTAPVPLPEGCPDVPFELHRTGDIDPITMDTRVGPNHQPLVGTFTGDWAYPIERAAVWEAYPSFLDWLTDNCGGDPACEDWEATPIPARVVSRTPVVYDETAYLPPLPTCFDGELNGDEEGVDCGDPLGVCKACDLHLEVASDERAIHVAWSWESPVEILYATDPDCDWDDVASCENGGWYAGAASGAITLTVDDDGLVANASYYVVGQDGSGLRGSRRGARPYLLGPGAVNGNFGVNVLRVEGQTLYTAGNFRMVGAVTGGGVQVGLDGQPVGAMPYIKGQVFAVLPDGAGGWYLGGSFTEIGGVPRSGLARIDAAGAVLPWDPSVTGFPVVRSIVVRGDVMYVAGQFGAVGGVARQNVAVLDLATGAVRSDWVADTDGTVMAIHVQDDALYLGGYFGNVNGVARSRLAAVDRHTGALVAGWDPGASREVETIDGRDDAVVIGGAFTSVGGEARGYIAALDATTGAALPWNPGASGSVKQVWLDGDTLYVGGTFTQLAGQSRSRLGAFAWGEAGPGAVLPWNPSANSNVSSIAVSDEVVYASGGFFQVGDVPRAGFAALDAESGALLSWDPNVWGSTISTRVGAAATQVFLGGNFDGAATRDVARLAAWDASTGHLLDWTAAIDDHVFALELYGGVAYLGGTFTTVDGTPRTRLAALDAATGALLPWDPGANGTVQVATLVDGVLYLGGAFTEVGGQPRSRLAAFDAATGALLPWSPSVADSQINGLTVMDGVVYVGGGFTSAGGEPRTRLAAFDAATGALLPWSPGADGFVQALAAADGVVYAGGSFTRINNVSRNRIAAVDGDTGALLAWHPGAMSGTVRAIGVDAERVVFGGEFSTVGGQPRENIAAADAATGALLPWSHGTSKDVYTLLARPGQVLVGGRFNRVGSSVPMTGLVSFDPATGAPNW